MRLIVKLLGVTCFLLQSKFNKLTHAAQVLRDDRSCRLMAVLRSYVAAVHITDIELDISNDNLPPNITIQKGLLALVQQWNDVLPEITHLPSGRHPTQHHIVNKHRASIFITGPWGHTSWSQAAEKKSLLARGRDLFCKCSGKTLQIMPSL